MVNFEEEKSKALEENSAQDIFNALRQLESDRPIQERRWAWELFQNAVDVATPEGVDCTFELSQDHLAFSHNGAPFTMKNVAHLILHGSTKSDEEKKIRFGTGFIATHLLSRLVRVEGRLDDGRSFQFELSRAAEDWKQMEKLMDKAGEDFQKSLASETVEGRNLTSYSYSLSEQGRNTAVIGLKAVVDNAPLLLALNQKLRSIKIKNNGKETQWTRDSGIKESDSVRLVPITGPSNASVALVSDETVTVALLLRQKDLGLEIESIQQVPKLYYDFPLAQTEDFPFPAAIVSSNFIPRNERDGLLLGSDEKDPSNIHNKSLFAEGTKLFIKLAEHACKAHWGNLHKLAEFSTGYSPQWLDSEWIRITIATLVGQIRNLEVVERDSFDGTMLPNLKPSQCLFPFDPDPKVGLTLRELASHLFSNSVPTKALFSNWSSIIRAWSYYTDVKVEDMAEVLTLPKLAFTVSQLGSLPNLVSNLKPEPKDKIEWYNEFSKLVLQHQSSLLESLELIPDQTSFERFRKKSSIFKDPGIDQILKEVMKSLGNEIFEILCNKNIDASLQDKLEVYEQAEVIRDAVDLIKKKVKTEYTKSDFQNANVALFRWLVKNKRSGELGDNFPVITSQKEREEKEFVTHLLPKQPLLSPVSLWPEDAKRHSIVFPEEKILSEDYLAATSLDQNDLQKEDWTWLSNQGLISQSLFMDVDEDLSASVIRDLNAGESLDPDDSHKTIDRIKLRSVAFIDFPNRGIDGARKTKARTKDFLDFILSFVVKNDDSWMSPITVKCSCKKSQGSHSIYPCKWLSLLRSHEWVCVGRNLEEKPTADNLSDFFQPQNPGMLSLLSENRSSLLLQMIGISTTQLMLASKTPKLKADVDKAFAKLLLATNSSPTELGKISEVYGNNALRSRIYDAYVQQQHAKTNRTIGKDVENTIRNILARKLDKTKFEVSEVPQEVGGSDVLIEVDAGYEFLSEDLKPVALRVVIESAELRIEVKSARQGFVRVTPKQAIEAIQNPDSHVICVVEIPSNFDDLTDLQKLAIVQSNARFLLDMGPQIGGRFQSASQLQSLEQGLKTAPQDDLRVELVKDSQIRLRIEKSFWTGGKVQTQNAEEFVDYVVKRRETIVQRAPLPINR